jgi:hypothetical protein
MNSAVRSRAVLGMCALIFATVAQSGTATAPPPRRFAAYPETPAGMFKDLFVDVQMAALVSKQPRYSDSLGHCSSECEASN